MNKTLFFSISFFLWLFSAVPACSQELVVFSNDTALAVRSHKEKDGFIYFTLPEGEFAVPKGQVKEIKKTDASRTADVSAAPGNSLELEVKKNAPVSRQRREGIRPLLGKPTGGPAKKDSAASDDSDEDDESSDDTASEDDEVDSPEPETPLRPMPQLPARIGGKPGQPVSPVINKR